MRCCSPTVIASGTSPGATASVSDHPGRLPTPGAGAEGIGGDVVAVVDVTGAIVVAATVVDAAVLAARSVVAEPEVVAPEAGGAAAGSPSSEQAATARTSAAPSTVHRASNGISSRLRPDRGCPGDHDADRSAQDQASTTTRASAAVAAAWRTSDSSNVVVQQANSSSARFGAGEKIERTNTSPSSVAGVVVPLVPAVQRVRVVRDLRVTSDALAAELHEVVVDLVGGPRRRRCGSWCRSPSSRRHPCR